MDHSASPPDFGAPPATEDGRRSSSRQRRQAVVALVIGGCTIVASCLVGYVTFQVNRETVFRRVAKQNLTIARTVANYIEEQPPADDEAARGRLLETVRSFWNRFVPPTSEAFLCVVTPQGKMAVCTSHPNLEGAQVSDLPLAQSSASGAVTIGDVLSTKQDFFGEDVSFLGERQLVGLTFSRSLDHGVIVHFPAAQIEREVAIASWPWSVGIGVVAGLLLPLSLGLLHRSYASEHRAALRSAAALRERTERLAEAQRVAHMGFLDWNLKTDEVVLSEEIHHIFGLRPGEIHTAPDMIQRAVHPDDLEQVKTDFDLAIKGVKRYDLDHRIVRPDGEVRWIHAQAKLIHDANGNADRLLGTVVDITDRKRAERKLLASEARYRRHFELGAIGMATSSPQKRWMEVNDRLCEMLGYSRDELLSKTWEELTAADDLPENVAMFEQTLAGERDSYVLDKRFIRKDGEAVDTILSAVCVRSEDGRVDYLLILARDITERKRAEQKLREGSELLRATHEANPDLQFILDSDGTIRQYHACDEAELFVSSKDFIGRKMQDVLPTKTGRQFRAAFDEASASGSLVTIEYALDVPNGERSYEGRIVPLPDRRLVVTVRDITERRHSEALQIEQSHILELISKGNMSLTEVLEAIIRFTESQFAQVRASVLFVNNRRLQHGAAPSMPASYNELIDGLEIGPRAGSCGTAAYRRERVIVADVASDPLWADYRELAVEHGFSACWSELVFDADGDVMATFALYHEQPGVPTPSETQLIETMSNLVRIAIDRKRTEEALQESEERLRLMIQQSPSAIELYDVDGLQVDVNKAYESLWGFPADHTVNQFNVLQSQQVEVTGLLEYVNRAYAGETVEVPEYEFDSRGETEGRGKGRVRWLSTRMYPLKDSEGCVHHIVITHEDITERKRAEEERLELEAQLRQSQKMEAIGQLAGGVAHDFNNLLTVILCNSEVLLTALAEETTVPPEGLMRSGLELIRTAGKQAASLTRQLLTFGRRDSAKPERLDPKTVVGDMEEMLRRMIGERIQLDFRLSTGTGCVLAAQGQIEQVIMNLVLNAVDATPTGGSVEIRVQNTELDDRAPAEGTGAKRGPHVMFSVADTGAGMTQETLEHMFEPFFTTKPVGKGTGLGLATVYGVAKQLGGHIHVDSKLGMGSTIRVFLPVVDKNEAEGGVAEERSRTGGGETILLCEDQDPVREVMCRTLRNAGYAVIESKNGERAIAATAAHDGAVDLLISDVVMPGINGRDLADRLTPDHPQMRVLFVSGYPADDLGAQADRGVAAELLPKPFGPQALLQRVREVLDREAAVG